MKIGILNVVLKKLVDCLKLYLTKILYDLIKKRKKMLSKICHYFVILDFKKTVTIYIKF